MSKVTETKKNEIANYSYEKATHELFAIEGNIIDYKIAINNKKAFLKDLKLHKEDELIKEIANLRMQMDKLKTTYDALATNEELSYFEKVKKRKDVKKELNATKKLYKAAKKLSTKKDYDSYLQLFNDDTLDKDNKKAKLDEVIANAAKLDKTKEISTVETEIVNIKTELTKYKKDNRQLRKLLKWQKIKRAKYGRLADEKKEILTLNRKTDASKIKELKKHYKDKKGKVLKYQSNNLSYYLMLLVVLIELIYIIVFLNKMYVSYMEFPTLIINLVFTLFLFLSAMKIKVYNKTWTTINFIYSAYLVLRIFVVIPFIASDHEAVYDDAGQIVQQALNYQSLRQTLYILSAVMLGLILLANIRSVYKIKQRTLHLD